MNVFSIQLMKRLRESPAAAAAAAAAAAPPPRPPREIPPCPESS